MFASILVGSRFAFVVLQSTECFCIFCLATLKALSLTSDNITVFEGSSSLVVIPKTPEPHPISIMVCSSKSCFLSISIKLSDSGLGISASGLTIKSLPKILCDREYMLMVHELNDILEV